MTDQKARPAFLTVLCILTWVGSGLVLIGQLFSLATAKVSKEIVGMAEEGMEEAIDEMAAETSEGFAGIFGKILGGSMQAMEHVTEMALVRIFGALVVLFGAILMWKLKKTGYFLFLGGKAIIIVGLYVITASTGMAFMFIGGPLFVAIVFSVLYGVNLKAMR